MKKKSQKAKMSASKNIDPARVGRGGYSGLEATLESRWKQLVGSYKHLADVKDERSIKYVVSRARKNPVTGKYELGPGLQSNTELTGTLENFVSICIIILYIYINQNINRDIFFNSIQNKKR
jgi:hypothetical protein